MLFALFIGVLVGCTSFISGVFGMAGGMILLLVLLSSGIEVASAMALHGIAQATGNFWRLLAWRRHARWGTIAWFALGTGLAVGAFSLVRITPDKATVLILLGLSPFAALALPVRFVPKAETARGAVLGGLSTMAITLVAGVAGPLLDAFFVRSTDGRREIVATKAGCQLIGNTTKTVYFGALAGTSIQLEPTLLLVAVVAPIVGTQASRLVLERLNDAAFRSYTKIVICLVGIISIINGVSLLMPEFVLPDYSIWVLAMLLAGLVGGLVAGLLGVGGGIVIVPVLYLVLGSLGVDEDIRMKIAVATSLATITFTSIASAKSHRARGSVDFGLVRTWSIPVFLGVVAGIGLASLVSGLVLTAVFALVAAVVAVQMLLNRDVSWSTGGLPNRVVKWLTGLVTGLVSALMGIGGGTISVPIMTAFGYDIRRAVGTASALGFVIAIPGTIGYIAAGWGAPRLPYGSLGFVNGIALVLLVPMTMVTAPVGARIAHSVPKRALKVAFALFLTITSARMAYDLLTHVS